MRQWTSRLAILFSVGGVLVACTSEVDTPVSEATPPDPQPVAVEPEPAPLGSVARAALDTYLASEQNQRDARFEPLLSICGRQPVDAATGYDLLSASFTDSPTQAYQNHLQFFVGGYGQELGDIYPETLFFPPSNFSVSAVGEKSVEVRSTAENVSGATGEINPDGSFGASYDFEDVEVERSFYCDAPEDAVTFLTSLMESGELPRD